MILAALNMIPVALNPAKAPVHGLDAPVGGFEAPFYTVGSTIRPKKAAPAHRKPTSRESNPPLASFQAAYPAPRTPPRHSRDAALAGLAAQPGNGEKFVAPWVTACSLSTGQPPPAQVKTNHARAFKNKRPGKTPFAYFSLGL
jgi:hypothetical protein